MIKLMVGPRYEVISIRDFGTQDGVVLIQEFRIRDTVTKEVTQVSWGTLLKAEAVAKELNEERKGFHAKYFDRTP